MEKMVRNGCIFKRVRALCGLLYALLLFNGCKSDAPVNKEAPAPKPVLTYPSFNKDSAYAYVRQQVLFGPRVPNTPAHEKCANWLAETLRRMGAEVQEQRFRSTAFDGMALKGVNIIARVHPQAKQRLLFAAHWDSRPWADSDPDPANRKKPFDSADDGPSGVGILLELVRTASTQPTKNIGFDIVLFDLEDYGTEGNEKSWALGSQYWSANTHFAQTKPRYGVLLDIVGGTNPAFYKEDYSVYFAADIVDKVWTLADDMGYGAYFPRQSGGGVLDDHYFVNTVARIKMINIINRPDGKRFPHYHHTAKDNMDVIDPNTLNMVGRLLVKLIYQEDAGLL